MTKLYMVLVSFIVEAEDEEDATKEAMQIVTDDSMTVESVREIKTEEQSNG